MLLEERTNVNVGIYVRVSTEEQAKEGFSIKAQIEKLSDYAKIRDWHIHNIYADNGISGKNITERPAINEMIKDIISKKVNMVLVFKVDRLTRNTRDLIELVDIFNKNDCNFNSLTESIDTQSASGRMFLKIIGIFAEFERENIVERTKSLCQIRASPKSKGRLYNISFGYNREVGQKIQTVNEKEADIVKWIFTKFLYENVSLTKIMDELNLKGIETKKGSMWSCNAIRRTLMNSNYIGRVRHHVNNYNNEYAEYEGKHEPIIDIETFEKAQKKLGKKSEKIRTKRPKEENFFTGTLYCSICGARLTTQGRYEMQKDGTKKYAGNYKCPNKVIKKCISKTMSHNKLERAFVEYIENIEDLEVPEEINIEQNNNHDEIEEMYSGYQEQLTKLEKKEKNIMTLYINGSLDFDEYTKMAKLVKNEVTKTKTEMEKLDMKLEEQEECNLSIDDVITNIKDNWLLLTNNEKMQFVNDYIRKITVCNQEQKNTCQGKIKIEKVEFYNE